MIAIPNMEKPKNCKVCPVTCEKLAFFDGLQGYEFVPSDCGMIEGE